MKSFYKYTNCTVLISVHCGNWAGDHPVVFIEFGGECIYLCMFSRTIRHRSEPLCSYYGQRAQQSAVLGQMCVMTPSEYMIMASE